MFSRSVSLRSTLRRIRLVSLTCIITAAQVLQAGPVNSAISNPDFASVYQTVKPSVVYIVVATSAGAQSGSGFVYDSDSAHSIIVTADHVIAGGQKIDVIFDSNAQRRYHATVLQHDRKRDVAFLDVPVGQRKALRLMDRPSITEGNPIAVVGYPRAVKAFEDVVGDDLRPSVHGGMISAVRLNGEIIQIDAETDHGDSGGPVIDAKSGQVVGIVRGTLLDTSYAARGLEKPLPGSAFAVSSTTLYAVRNGVDSSTTASANTPGSSASTTNTSSNGSAAYRVAFVTPSSTNATVTAIDNLFTQRIREHFTSDNTFYAIPAAGFSYGADSSAISTYCDDRRVNAVVVPFYQFRADAALAGNAGVTIGMLVTDCYGIPFFTMQRSKSESRMFSNRVPAREVIDMGNDLIDQVLSQFDTYRVAHAAAWQNLLKKGEAVDPGSASSPMGVAVAVQDRQYRVVHLRDGGRAVKAGLRIGDILKTVDGTPIDPKTTGFQLDQMIESAHAVEVERPEGKATITF